MTIDSSIRLKQISNPEVSGYILNVVENYLTGNAPLPTGNATGLFYPLTTNPSGFVTSGQLSNYVTSSTLQITINSAITQTLSYVSKNYLPFIGTTITTGIFSNPTSIITGNFNLNYNNTIYLVDSSQTVITGILPNAIGLMGFQFIIKDYQGNCANNNITLMGSLGQTIDSVSSYIMNVNYLSTNLLSDGSNWYLV